MGQRANAYRNVSCEGLRVICGRDHASNRRMSHNPFQKKLSPGVAIEFSSPRRQGFVGKTLKHTATPKRTIDDDPHAKFLGERQDAPSRTSIHQRIIDLDEIGLLDPHVSFYFAEAAVLGIGNSGIADSSLRFPFAK